MIKDSQIADLACKYKLRFAAVKMFLEVESNGKGFADNGKLIIQFEPSWMLKLLGIGKGKAGAWANNGVGNQTVEWVAFNLAYKISPDKAMQSTSIGLMQVLGLHYKRLGFATVGAMWDFAKKSEVNQLELGLMFVKTDLRLLTAVLELNFDRIAYYYNGSGYKELAAKLGTTPYDAKLKASYLRYA